MKKAFSLMELMIVIIILGLLASLVLPNLMGKSEGAKRKLTCVQMQSIAQSLDMFKLDNGRYPETEEGLKALVSNPDPSKYANYPEKGYLSRKSIPKDPWGHEYIYLSDGDEFDIVSLGADGKEGGEGNDKDIRYSECSQK